MWRKRPLSQKGAPWVNVLLFLLFCHDHMDFGPSLLLIRNLWLLAKLESLLFTPPSSHSLQTTFSYQWLNQKLDLSSSTRIQSSSLISLKREDRKRELELKMKRAMDLVDFSAILNIMIRDHRMHALFWLMIHCSESAFSFAWYWSLYLIRTLGQDKDPLQGFSPPTCLGGWYRK